MEPKFLQDVLFGGMTANAFKAGTVLTGGWFWMRRAGCCVLYRGDSIERVDFGDILAVTGSTSREISPPQYVRHDSSSTYYYVLRKVNGCGYEERSLSATVKVSVDSSGELVRAWPNNLLFVQSEQIDSEKVRLVWYYCPLKQQSELVCFKIYYDGGTGEVDYENPLATIDYGGNRYYGYEIDCLSGDTYLFSVKAVDAQGRENAPSAPVAIELARSVPAGVEILDVQAD